MAISSLCCLPRSWLVTFSSHCCNVPQPSQYDLSVITSANMADVMWSFFGSVSFCEQDYLKSNEPISLKLGPRNQKNWLTFCAALVPDTDSGSLFHFPHQRRIGNFRRFISISHTVTAQFLRNLVKKLTPTNVTNPQHGTCNEFTTFWERSHRHLDLD